MLTKLSNWFFGIPWVFQKLRYAVLGGFSFGPAYARLNVQPDDVILDIGCGMGDAMRHLPPFKTYHGFDTDARAINTFRDKYPQDNIRLNQRVCTAADIEALDPTKCVMVGLLHHLDDEQVRTILRALSHAQRLQGAITVDTVFVPGRWVNNALARADRGRHVRKVEGYRALIDSAGLRIAEEYWIVTGNHAARYYCTLLQKR